MTIEIVIDAFGRAYVVIPTKYNGIEIELNFRPERPYIKISHDVHGFDSEEAVIFDMEHIDSVIDALQQLKKAMTG